MPSAGHRPAVRDRARHLLPGCRRAGDEAAGIEMKSHNTHSEQTHSTVSIHRERERKRKDRAY